jgi:hypothetical protein
MRKMLPRVRAPKARNAKAWGNAPGQRSTSFEALKARNSDDSSKAVALAVLVSFRAFGAGRVDFDITSESQRPFSFLRWRGLVPVNRRFKFTPIFVFIGCVACLRQRSL